MKSKPQPPIVARLNAGIEIFGWRMNVDAATGHGTQRHEKAQLELDAEKIDDCCGKTGMRFPKAMTASFWRLLLISPAVLHTFRKLADARALAEFFCPSTRQLSIWRGLASNAPNDTEVTTTVYEILSGIPARVTTQAGMVRHGEHEKMPAIWFGNAATLPAFHGDAQIVAAVRTLFRIAGGSVDLGEDIW